MPNTITGPVGAQTPMDNTVVTNLGVVDAGASIGVNMSSSSTPHILLVAGNVVSELGGVSLGQGDELIVSQSGVVAGFGNPDADGVVILGADTHVTVAGYVFAEDGGIFVSGSADGAVIEITSTGVVQSYGNGGSYALALGGPGNATYVNFGTILAEANVVTGEIIAFANAGSAPTTFNGLDESTDSVADFTNGGVIIGDMYFAAGNDRYTAVDGGYVDGLISMGSGQDLMSGSSETEIANGGSGSDNLLGRGGDDELSGGNGSDFVGGGTGSDIIHGENGDDTIRGGADDDLIFGDAGSDTINGGTGDDLIFGGANADLFIFVRDFGDDVIFDFVDNNAEQIDLSGVGSIRNFNDLVNNHLSEVAGSAVISDGQGNSITLDGFAAADLDAGDFVF